MNLNIGQPIDARYAPVILGNWPIDNNIVGALARPILIANAETQSKIGYPSDPNAAGGDIFSIQMVIRPYLQTRANAEYNRSYNGILEVNP